LIRTVAGCQSKPIWGELTMIDIRGLARSFRHWMIPVAIAAMMAPLGCSSDEGTPETPSTKPAIPEKPTVDTGKGAVAKSGKRDIMDGIPKKNKNEQ